MSQPSAVIVFKHHSYSWVWLQKIGKTGACEQNIVYALLYLEEECVQM